MILVDGEPVDRVPVSDRGLAYGDGLFETIRLVAGRAPLWDYHLRRLQRDCRRLGLSLPNPQLLQAELTSVCGGGDATVRLTLTRGGGPRGYSSFGADRPRRIVQAFPAPTSADAPLRAVVCRGRLASGGQLVGIKHLSRLENVLLANEVQRAGADEGVVFDDGGRLVAGTAANLFIIDPSGRVRTPLLDRCGVAGVYRSWLCDHAPIDVETMALADLRTASAVFFTNAVRGIMPVLRIDGVAELDVAPVLQLEQAIGTPW